MLLLRPQQTEFSTSIVSVMNPELKVNFYNKLKDDKIKINWNENPIRMELFLSFLTIEVERSRAHLGSNNGWTKLYNKEHGLIVSGGVLGAIEYLDHIEYGIKLSNPYNNYVNPFYLFVKKSSRRLSRR